MPSSPLLVVVVLGISVIVVAIALSPSLVVAPVLAAISIVVVAFAVSQVKRSATEGGAPSESDWKRRTTPPESARTAARTEALVDEQPAPLVAEQPTPLVAEQPQPLAAEQPQPLAAEQPQPLVGEQPQPLVDEQPQPLVGEERVPSPTVRDDEARPSGDEAWSAPDRLEQGIASMLAAFDTLTRELEAFLPEERRQPGTVGAAADETEEPLSDTVPRVRPERPS